MRFLKILLFVLLGFVVGAVLGALLPVGLYLFFMALNGGGDGAGTAFAILTILTTPVGAVFGAACGIMRGRTGEWAFPSGKPTTPLVGPEHALPEERAARSLAPDRVDWFLDLMTEHDGIASNEAKLKFFKASIADYREIVGNAKWGILIWVLLSFPIPFIFVPVLIGTSISLGRQIYLMRNRLSEVASKWNIDLSDPSLNLPRSLCNYEN